MVNPGGVSIITGKGMEICHKKVGSGIFLKRKPIFQNTEIMANVQGPSGAHSRNSAFFFIHGYFQGSGQAKDGQKGSRGPANEWPQYMAQEAGSKENEQDDKTEPAYLHIFPGQARGQEIGKYFTAIEGWNREEIKPSEAEIDDYAGLHGRECENIPAMVFPLLWGQTDERGSQAYAEQDSQQEIGSRPGDGHKHHVFGWITEVAWINRDRFGPAKHKGTGQAGEAKYGEAHWIDMGNGVESKASLLFCSGIAQFACYPAMCYFMENDSEKGRNNGNCNQPHRMRKIKVCHRYILAEIKAGVELISAKLTRLITSEGTIAGRGFLQEENYSLLSKAQKIVPGSGSQQF